MASDPDRPEMREALQWLVRVNDDRATEADRRALESWLSASDSHAVAWREAQAVWNRFAPIERELKQRDREGRPSRRTLLALAAGGLAVGAGGASLLRRRFAGDYRTGHGETLMVELDDGSSVFLGAGSALDVDYTPQERRVALQRGQGFFTVAADAARPFVATAANGAVRALGTRFDILVRDDEVAVTSFEHAVAVSVPTRDPVTLSDGYRLTYGEGWISDPVEADIEAVGAWRHGRLVFRNTPLRHVLREIERQGGWHILLLNEAAGEIPVSSVFDIAHTRDALDLIDRTLPVSVIHTGTGVVLVR